MQPADDLCHVVVGGIGIHDHAIMSAAFVKIGFLKVAHFHGRIDQSIIIFRMETTVLGGRERSANVPSIGHVIESHGHERISPIRGIHQNFREIEKRVMRIELGSERACRVDENLILHRCSILRCSNFPAALVELRDFESWLVAAPLAYPQHVLREISDLVESIPDWQLQLALCSPRRNLYSDVNAMRGRIGQGDSVVNDWALKSRCAWQAEKQETSAGNQQVGFSWRPLGFYFVPLAVKSL